MSAPLSSIKRTYIPPYLIRPTIGLNLETAPTLAVDRSQVIHKVIQFADRPVIAI